MLALPARRLVALLLICAAAPAAAAEYADGVDYQLVRESTPPADPARITVEEFFWYGCPHCYDAEPAIEAWLAGKPADVDFIRVPSSLGRDVGLLHSKAFYAAQLLDVLPVMHRALFAAIHDQHRALATEAEIVDLFAATAHVSPEDVASAMNGFMVGSSVERAEDAFLRYGLRGVPVIVVGGRYLIRSEGHTGADTGVADFLIDLVRTERAKGQAQAPPAPVSPRAPAPAPPAAPPAWGLTTTAILLAAGLAVLVLVVIVVIARRRRG